MNYMQDAGAWEATAIYPLLVYIYMDLLRLCRGFIAVASKYRICGSNTCRNVK